jgi:signal transduction histidine kinase
MNGRLDVSSREGGGSRFDIVLPASTDAHFIDARRRIAS